VTEQLRRRGQESLPPSDGRPVLLATFFSVPFDKRASNFAVESAIEAGVPLIVTNVVELAPLAMSVRLGYDYLGNPPEIERALQAPVELASSFGVHTERLLVRTPRPIAALLQLTAERRPGLLILGSEDGRLSSRFSRRLWRKVRASAACLVWRPDQWHDRVEEEQR
jgi:nucleotide-binding universal stress UspA family protein